MDLIYQYFLSPIMRNGWFNPVNSLLYGIILVAGAWFVFNLLRYLKVRIDLRLFVSLLPFIAFAGVTRTLRDYIYAASTTDPAFFASFPIHIQKLYQNAYTYVVSITGNQPLASAEAAIITWFPTPGSYIITFVLALASLFISLGIQKKMHIPYWKTLFVIGMAMFLFNAALLPLSSTVPLTYIGLVSLAWAALFFGLGYLPGTGFMKGRAKKIGKLKELNKFLGEIFTGMNSSIMSAHLFDATATFFAIALFSTVGGQGYTEQHFLSRTLMPFLGPQVMFLLKLVVVLPVLYFINRHVEDKEFRNFMLLIVLILGLAPASRNLARLMVGV